MRKLSIGLVILLALAVVGLPRLLLDHRAHRGRIEREVVGQPCAVGNQPDVLVHLVAGAFDLVVQVCRDPEQVAELAVLLDDPSGAQLQSAAEAVQKMQFLNKLHAEAEAIEADLEEAF